MFFYTLFCLEKWSGKDTNLKKLREHAKLEQKRCQAHHQKDREICHQTNLGTIRQANEDTKDMLCPLRKKQLLSKSYNINLNNFLTLMNSMYTISGLKYYSITFLQTKKKTRLSKKARRKGSFSQDIWRGPTMQTETVFIQLKPRGQY